MKAVIVCGARIARMEDWHDAIFSNLSVDAWGISPRILMHGACGLDADDESWEPMNMRGIDMIAGHIGKEIGWKVVPMPAPWKRMGDGAGPFRNMQMLSVLMALGQCGYEIAVLAFHNDLVGGSRGTKNMVARAKLAGVPYAVYDHTGHAYLESSR